MSDNGKRALDVTARRMIDDLRELIIALDGRVPHLERVGESEIARDAAALRRKAVDRIAKLERQFAQSGRLTSLPRRI